MVEGAAYSADTSVRPVRTAADSSHIDIHTFVLVATTAVDGDIPTQGVLRALCSVAIYQPTYPTGAPGYI